MNVLILDDELFVRENIISEIDWLSLKIDQVFECDNGRDAEALCSNISNDIAIIISDIRMPENNGIDIVERILQKQPYIKVVFISGYPEKNYLKSAIKLQAVDFIEKPIDMEELYSTLKNITAITQKKEMDIANIQLLERRNAINELSVKLILPEPDWSLIYTLCEKCSFPVSSIYMTCTFRLQSNSENSDEEQLLDELIKQSSKINNEQFNAILGLYHHCIIMHIANNAIDKSIFSKKVLMNIIKDYTAIITKSFFFETICGVSEPIHDIKDLRTSYNQSVIALQQAFYLEKGCFAEYKNIVGPPYTFNNNLNKEFNKSIFTRDLDYAKEILLNLYSELQGCKNTLPVNVKNTYYSFGEVICEYAQSQNIELQNTFANKFLMAEHINTRLYLRDIQNEFQSILADIKSRYLTFDFGNEIVNKTAYYISNNFSAKNLSITQIAREMHVSPTYLSGLFKTYTQITINQYIIATRIEYAKKLLCITTKSVNDISEEVGFYDSGYFSKVFSKETNFTPSEYRRHNI